MPCRTPSFPVGNNTCNFFFAKKNITNLLFECFHGSKGKFPLFPIKNSDNIKSLWHVSICRCPQAFSIEKTKDKVVVFIHYSLGRKEEESHFLVKKHSTVA